MVNTLYESMTTGSDKTVVLDIVDRTASFTVAHFGTEERYMEKYDYPGMATRKKEHQDFVEKVLQVKDDLENGTTDIS